MISTDASSVVGAESLARTERETAALSVRGLHRTFERSDGQKVTAIKNVDLTVAAGEVVVLLGPSGCGKTTLLRAVAGLETPDEGSIDVGAQTVFSTESKRVVNIPTEKRKLSMMFQSYALWPHMNVFDNISYPLKMRRDSRNVIRDRVTAALNRTNIDGLGSEYPQQLSGGQQQRVALARAIVDESSLILFDEPLSNVDAKVRTELRLQLIALQQRLGFAALYVTHDQVEAMEIGHRIAVMSGGSVAQIGTPHEIYERPTSRYVANFVGAVNELEGTIAQISAGEVLVDTAVGRISVAPDSAWDGLSIGDEAIVIFRPEWTRIREAGYSGANVLPGEVVRTLYVGTHSEIFIRSGELTLKAWNNEGAAYEPGSSLTLSVDAERARLVPPGAKL